MLNDQTEALFEWRSHIVSLLTMKLIEDAQEGDELSPYERALETQRECEDYMMAFQSLLVSPFRLVTSHLIQLKTIGGS